MKTLFDNLVVFGTSIFVNVLKYNVVNNNVLKYHKFFCNIHLNLTCTIMENFLLVTTGVPKMGPENQFLGYTTIKSVLIGNIRRVIFHPVN